MKSNERVQKITVYDISKINEALASKDLPKLLLNGNAEIALITQRIIKKRLRKDPDGFTSRELTTMYGVANDKVLNEMKKDTKKEGNRFVQEEKNGLIGPDVLRKVREKQRKAQEQVQRELEERREQEQEEREQEERRSASAHYRL